MTTLEYVCRRTGATLRACDTKVRVLAYRLKRRAWNRYWTFVAKRNARMIQRQTDQKVDGQMTLLNQGILEITSSGPNGFTGWPLERVPYSNFEGFRRLPKLKKGWYVVT